MKNSKYNKGDDFNARWEQAINDAREAARRGAQLTELQRQRELDEKKRLAPSPLTQLGLAAIGSGMGILGNRGFGAIGDLLFGPSAGAAGAGTAAGAAGAGGAATGSGAGLFSSLFGGGSSSGAATTAAPSSGGLFSSLFGGGGSGAASAAAPGETAGASSALGGSSIAGYAIPAAGLLGLYDVFKNKRKGLRGTAEGAASGVALGSPLGPIGMGVGGALGGLYGALSSKFDKDSWDTERKRLQDLKDQGYNIPQNLFDSSPTKGRSIEELINHNYANDFVGRGKDNEWVNNTFAQSRNESDLRPEDVVGYSAFIKNFGNNYLNASLEKKLALAKYALENGLINEHQGTIDINKTNDLENQAKQILGY